ncbi:hypothetical protein AZI86_08100 [Bdellovibrio bacteriovorus]|uniref:Uncharacterized protein n=1 Tax=Bdellovibrio bacteriovorus TaxID=959 RepID=A0A150WRM0_BDEBC|nr:hypothetical protein [Bdellovibrio bacteriovorus]KYG66974.1 hypothetical protein AZI86_08100 [Bdellovibrio bacteriovorus]
MRLKCLCIGILFSWSWAFADESSVYLCGLGSKPGGEVVVRLKQYFDLAQNMTLGKIDRIYNAEVLESSDTKVYQIPIFQQDYYLQLWYGSDVSVEAQLLYDQGNSAFHAIYKKKTEKLNLICHKTHD